MFATSSQAKNWMFGSEEVLNRARDIANKNYVAKHSRSTSEKLHYLSRQEEQDVLQYFEVKLAEFCAKFKPPMPKSVIGTSFSYFKRFYLKNSIMDYHPKEILVTAIYLASKVEEFNISIGKFVENIPGNRERAARIILNNELLLLKELNFHLTIHNPFRPMEGFLIDLKTRCDTIENIDSLRPEIDSFLDQVYRTDVILIYSPSQIALAAIIHAASRQKQNLDRYVTDLLFAGQGHDAIVNIVTCVRQIRVMVKNIKDPVRNIKALCDRLDKCRNQDNNPDSAAYKRKLEELVDEDDHIAQPKSKSSRTDSDLGLKSLSPGAN
jgi:cyclin H